MLVGRMGSLQRPTGRLKSFSMEFIVADSLVLSRRIVVSGWEIQARVDKPVSLPTDTGHVACGLPAVIYSEDLIHDLLLLHVKAGFKLI